MADSVTLACTIASSMWGCRMRRHGLLKCAPCSSSKMTASVRSFAKARSRAVRPFLVQTLSWRFPYRQAPNRLGRFLYPHCEGLVARWTALRHRIPCDTDLE